MRRIDPEPITIAVIAAIVGATAGTISMSIAAINYRKTHFKDAPSVVRRKMLKHIYLIDRDLQLMSGHLETVEAVFAQAKYPGGRVIRLGNGALVTLVEFKRYQTAWDAVLKGLRSVSRRTLKVELLSNQVGHLDKRRLTVKTGRAIEAFREVLESPRLAVNHAFTQLKAGIAGTSELLEDLRRQLDDVGQTEARA